MEVAKVRRLAYSVEVTSQTLLCLTTPKRVPKCGRDVLLHAEIATFRNPATRLFARLGTGVGKDLESMESVYKALYRVSNTLSGTI